MLLFKKYYWLDWNIVTLIYHELILLQTHAVFFFLYYNLIMSNLEYYNDKAQEENMKEQRENIK